MPAVVHTTKSPLDNDFRVRHGFEVITSSLLTSVILAVPPKIVWNSSYVTLNEHSLCLLMEIPKSSMLT